MKIISKRFIRKHEIDFLKKGRNRFIYNKVTNFNGNFIEHLTTEKLIRVAPQHDEILELIIQHLDPALEDTWFDYQWRPKNYDFASLPRKLKSYMIEMDEILYNQAYLNSQKFTPAGDYNSRIEKLEKTILDYDDLDFENYVIVGKPIPSSIGRKAKESARRAYKTVNGILKSNINKFSHFVTLTFAPSANKIKHMELNANRLKHEYNINFDYEDSKDFEVVKKKFSQQINNFSKKIRDHGFDFQYLAVWELQKNGSYHFHLVTTRIPASELYKVPSWLDYDHREDKFNKGYGLIYWNYGKSDVQEIKNHAELSTYLSKYILKSFYNVQEDTYEQYKGQKKYFPSRGLVRPIESYMDSQDVEKALSVFDLGDYEPYEKNYTNPYNDGQITNRIYTLLDKKILPYPLVEDSTTAQII